MHILNHARASFIMCMLPQVKASYYREVSLSFFIAFDIALNRLKSFAFIFILPEI